MAKVEWRTLAAVFGCYALWTVSTLLFEPVEAAFGSFAAFAMLFFLTSIAAAFHTSLQHEVVHGHPTANPAINETLVFPSLIIVYPFRRYQDLHLKHHIDGNLTDPFEDPESYFWPQSSRRNMPKLFKHLLKWNNTLAGRLVLGPPIGLFGFYRTELKRFAANEPGIRKAWALHGLSLAMVFIWVSYVCGIPVWAYLLLVAYPGVSWILIRSFAEHRASTSIGGRTAIVESGPFFSLLFLNNNLHMVHHAHPQVPWYELPTLYKERAHHYMTANDGYRYKSYSDVARQYAFRVKQPVFHPLIDDTTNGNGK